MSDETDRSVGAQIDRLMKKRGWDQGDLGRAAGYAGPSHINRLINGKAAQDNAIIRAARALECEVRIVPEGSRELVLARLEEANERELQALSSALDFLLDFRGEPEVLKHFENDLGMLRERLKARRALLDGTAS